MYEYMYKFPGHVILLILREVTQLQKGQTFLVGRDICTYDPARLDTRMQTDVSSTLLTASAGLMIFLPWAVKTRGYFKKMSTLKF